MNNTKIDKLEAIRGFCALYVVLFHLLPQKIFFLGINIGILFRFGSEAVIMFFILSGFVIKYSWEKATDKSFQNFFFKRLVRIYVPLLFIFLLAYGIKCYNEGSIADPEWGTLLGNLLMLQDVISLKPNVISSVYMGNGVLWSLSYEWWFYMLFMALIKNVSTSKINTWVNILTILAAITYLFYPFFLNRILMYFALWWIGVQFADIYLKGAKFSLKSMQSYAFVLMAIIILLGLNLYFNFNYTKTYQYPLVAYPIVELRNFVFAFIVMFGALIWNHFNWFGFNRFFGVFKYLAPISYVIYISHHYLVIQATYLDFIHNRVVECLLYIVVMFVFSYLLEVVVYTKIKNSLHNAVLKQPINN
ncbi:acyltransferase family protein [Flavobacterium flavipallidum]|uniref:Acyltransferase n=1 Tax=Flavobacterium flavipallidum TaxID=3139140 RepID=A0ABU9HIJ0_9FLAO